MTLQEIRDDNRNRVLETALEMFIEKGIEQVKIKDVAKNAGLTERSIFRYFPTKSDLVLETAITFWEKATSGTKEFNFDKAFSGLEGQPLIEAVLKTYAKVFLSKKDALIFIEEAEIYLYRKNMLNQFTNKPISSYREGALPLAHALSLEVQSGRLKNLDEVEIFFHNVFDGLLGLMQKLSTAAYNSSLSDEERTKRLDYFCQWMSNGLFLKS